MRKQLSWFLIVSLLLIATASSSMSFAAKPIPEWRLGAEMPFGGREGHAGGQIGNMIYIAQGYYLGELSSTIAYDIVNDTWITGLATAPSARAELASVTHGGLLYTIGGRYEGYNNLEVYNPVMDEWNTLPEMPTGRVGLGAAVVGNKIYAIGGRDGNSPHSGSPLNVVEVYDIAKGAWSEEDYTPMPTSRMDIYSTISHNGKIYVIGGYDGASALDTVEMYDPTKDEWVALEPMTTPRSNLTASIKGNTIYAIGGINTAGSKLSTVEAYDINSGEWAPAPNLVAPTAETVSFFHGGRIYVLGGGIFGVSNNLTQILKP